MKKQVKSINGNLFKKEISSSKLNSITGGYTLTGCNSSLATNGNEYECSDTDADAPAETIAPL